MVSKDSASTSGLGTIEVSVEQKLHNGEVYSREGGRRTFGEVGIVSEKALKGQAISHSVK